MNKFTKIENITNSIFFANFIVVLIISILIVKNNNLSLFIKLFFNSLLDNAFVMLLLYVLVLKFLKKSKFRSLKKISKFISWYIVFFTIESSEK